MLLNINTKTRYAEKRRTERLQSFGLDERALQDILFRSLDRLFPDDEMILLMQSRRWQEEPDLMAVDKKGNLVIFELKAWESHSPNLLQVLRYGQIYGGRLVRSVGAARSTSASIAPRSVFQVSWNRSRCSGEKASFLAPKRMRR